MKRIKFIAHYPAEKNPVELHSSPAAKDQIDYICDLLSTLNYEVEIMTLSQRLSYNAYRPKKTMLENGVKVSEFFSILSRRRVGFRISKYVNDLIIFFRILLGNSRDTSYIIYHMNTNYPLTMLALKFKKMGIVLQVNELYSEVGAGGYWRNRNSELKFINSFDRFILSTRMLSRLIKNKSLGCVIEGPIVKNEVKDFRPNDNIEYINEDEFRSIKLVYAGTLSRVKNGPYLAIDALKKLPTRYHLTVLGVGSDKEFDDVKLYSQQVEDFEHRVEIRRAIMGKELTDFLSKCDIGLATQDASALLNASSFPSKVYLYLNNGLRVVAPATEALTNSMVAQMMSFYDGNSGESIALAIVDSRDSNSVEVYMDKLHQHNLSSLKSVLEGGL